MKKITIIIICLLIAQAGVAQQKVIIGTRTVNMVYKGQKASLKMPLISARYPALKTALCDTALLFGDNLKSVVERYKTDGSGITDFSYEVTFQNTRVISMVLRYETIGAYPSTSEQWLTLDIATGKQHDLTKEISKAGINRFFAAYTAALRQEVIETRKAMAEDREVSKEEAEEIASSLTENIHKMKPADLSANYIFTGLGITFNSNPVLPHAVASFDIERSYPVNYARLKPYKLPTALVLK